MKRCPECGHPEIERTFVGCWRRNLTAKCRRSSAQAWEQPVKPKLGGRPRAKRRLAQLRRHLLG